MKKAIILSKFIPVLFITSLIFLLFSFIYSSVKTSALKDLEEEKQLFEVSEKRFAAIRKDMKDWEDRIAPGNIGNPSLAPPPEAALLLLLLCACVST